MAFRLFYQEFHRWTVTAGWEGVVWWGNLGLSITWDHGKDMKTSL